MASLSNHAFSGSRCQKKSCTFRSIWDVECILYMFKHSHHLWPDKHVVRQIIATATLFVKYCITNARLFRNNRSFMMKFGGITSIGVGLFHVLCYHVVTCMAYTIKKKIVMPVSEHLPTDKKIPLKSCILWECEQIKSWTFVIFVRFFTNTKSTPFSKRCSFIGSHNFFSLDKQSSKRSVQ